MIMKTAKLLLILFISSWANGQGKQPEDYGYRYIKTTYQNDPVDILVKSRKGEESIPKPLLLFCQGSLPVPLMINYKSDGRQGIYAVFPFRADSLARDYHLVIIGKPYIPLMVRDTALSGDMVYRDKSGGFPQKYIERNLLDYYVARNISVLRFLSGQPWAGKKRLVVAGHSEGSTIAAKMASEYAAITHLVYSGGNPLGRVMTLLSRARASHIDTANAENVFRMWENIVEDPANMESAEDTFKGTFQFSFPPPLFYLEKLAIPVLVTYGTKDEGLVGSVDYFRLEMIRMKKANFTFRAYPELNHDFFRVKPNGEIDFDTFFWDKVANDWDRWLQSIK